MNTHTNIINPVGAMDFKVPSAEAITKAQAEKAGTGGATTPQPSEEEKKERKKLVDRIIELAVGIELYKTSSGQAFARIPVGNHKELWAVGSHTFTMWLKRLYFEAVGSVASKQILEEANSHFECMALFGGEEKSVAIRVAAAQGNIYVDLCDKEWQVVEITSSGWKVLKDSPVLFRRTENMLALPVPVTGGKLEVIDKFITAETKDIRFVKAFLLQCLKPEGPFPQLEIGGEQGSAKSTLTRLVKFLIDPNEAPLNRPPANEEEIAQLAQHEYLLAFDNMSGISHAISDALCRVATGGALKGRTLFTNAEQTVLKLMRPVAYNGIEDIATRPDLQERGIKIFLPTIHRDKRMPEGKYWAELEEARPKILGALYSAIAKGLENLPTTSLKQLPRLADFGLWITACEPALGWEPGSFIKEYFELLAEVNASSLDGDELAQAVMALMSSRQEFTGTNTETLEKLNNLASDQAKRSRGWPTRKSLRSKLTRLAPVLREQDIHFDYHRSKEVRTYTFQKGKRDSVILSPEPENP